MIDVARDVSTDRRIYADTAVEDEQEGVVLGHAVIVIAAVRLRVADVLTRVLDESRVLGNELAGIDAAPMDPGTPHDDPWIAFRTLGRPAEALSARGVLGHSRGLSRFLRRHELRRDRARTLVGLGRVPERQQRRGFQLILGLQP